MLLIVDTAKVIYVARNPKDAMIRLFSNYLILSQIVNSNLRGGLTDKILLGVGTFRSAKAPIWKIDCP